MSNTTTQEVESTDPRPRYIVVGEDTEGADHLYRTVDETVLAINGGRVVERNDLTGRHLDDYVRFVRDDVTGREWADREYNLPGEFLADAVGELKEAM